MFRRVEIILKFRQFIDFVFGLESAITLLLTVSGEMIGLLGDFSLFALSDLDDADEEERLLLLLLLLLLAGLDDGVFGPR